MDEKKGCESEVDEWENDTKNKNNTLTSLARINIKKGNVENTEERRGNMKHGNKMKRREERKEEEKGEKKRAVKTKETWALVT